MKLNWFMMWYVVGGGIHEINLIWLKAFILIKYQPPCVFPVRRCDMASRGYGIHAVIMIFVGIKILTKLEDTVSFEINMLFHWNFHWDHGGGDLIFW